MLNAILISENQLRLSRKQFQDLLVDLRTEQKFVSADFERRYQAVVGKVSTFLEDGMGALASSNRDYKIRIKAHISALNDHCINHLNEGINDISRVLTSNTLSHVRITTDLTRNSETSLDDSVLFAGTDIKKRGAEYLQMFPHAMISNADARHEGLTDVETKWAHRLGSSIRKDMNPDRDDIDIGNDAFIRRAVGVAVGNAKYPPGTVSDDLFYAPHVLAPLGVPAINSTLSWNTQSSMGLGITSNAGGVASAGVFTVGKLATHGIAYFRLVEAFVTSLVPAAANFYTNTYDTMSNVSGANVLPVNLSLTTNTGTSVVAAAPVAGRWYAAPFHSDADGVFTVTTTSAGVSAWGLQIKIVAKARIQDLLPVDTDMANVMRALPNSGLRDRAWFPKVAGLVLPGMKMSLDSLSVYNNWLIENLGVGHLSAPVVGDWDTTTSTYALDASVDFDPQRAMLTPDFWLNIKVIYPLASDADIALMWKKFNARASTLLRTSTANCDFSSDMQ